MFETYVRTKSEAMKKVLIANHHLKNLEGSELHCLELAEYFLSLGYVVEVAAFIIGKPMSSRFDELDIIIKNLSDIQSKDTYDLIWSHHKPVFYYLHMKLRVKSKFFVHQQLSPFVGLEFFPLFSDSKIDSRLLIFANSSETKSISQKQSDYSNINVLNNSVPDIFYNAKKRVSHQINRIAVISSHPPIEIRTAMRILEMESIKVDFFGKQDKVEKITPELLISYDLVITIGKTVQYCFASMTPVYNYDYHGGIGYISPSDVPDLEFYNYSGRYPGLTKSPELLSSEIKKGYQNSLKYLKELKEISIKRYKLDIQLKSYLEPLDFTSPPAPLELSESELLMERDLRYVLPKVKKKGISRIIDKFNRIY